MNRQPPRPRIYLLLGLLLLGLLGLGVLRMKVFQPAWARDQQTLDQQAIEKVLTDQAAAWNRGDLEAFMQGYWNSPELTFYSGDKPRLGWDETLKRYRQRYQGIGQEQEPLKLHELTALMLDRYRQQNPAPDKEMGQLKFGELRIEMLGPDSAFVRGRWALLLGKGKIGGLFTLIFQRRPEGWRIIHDHTS